MIKDFLGRRPSRLGVGICDGDHPHTFKMWIWVISSRPHIFREDLLALWILLISFRPQKIQEFLLATHIFGLWSWVISSGSHIFGGDLLFTISIARHKFVRDFQCGTMAIC